MPAVSDFHFPQSSQLVVHFEGIYSRCGFNLEELHSNAMESYPDGFLLEPKEPLLLPVPSNVTSR